MSKARLMNTKEDFEKLGVKENEIEMWEDGRRSPMEKGTWEWWYFDAILDDGTNVVIQFFTDAGVHMKSDKNHPKFKIRVTLPDGTEYKQGPEFSLDEVSWSKEKCDVRYGKHFFTGDLKDYHIHVDPIKGLGADIHLHSLSKPYRPASVYFDFHDGKYYTWFCVVPKGEVNGTLTINGKEIQIHGYGYHDHQWGNIAIVKDWNHWVWARQSFEDCSILVFDMVSAERTEYTRFPIVFIQDNEGNVLYESNDNVNCQILYEYHDDISEKDYPRSIHYIFEKDGKKVDYTLESKRIIETNGKNNLPFAQKLVAKTLGVNASYTRYDAVGTLVFNNQKRTGKLIYEFMYPGNTYKGHM